VQNQNFDACFICFAELLSEARTLNFARTLIKYGKRVCIIALGNENEVIDFQREGINFFNINTSKFKRAWKRWLLFRFYANKYLRKISVGTIWAEDLFSLPIAKKIKIKSGGKLIYDSREIYSQIVSDKKRAYSQKFLTNLEKSLLPWIDEIIVTGQLDEVYLKEYFKINIPFHVIMNLPPKKPAIKSNILREKFSIPPECPVIVYQGMIMQGRGLLPVIKSLEYFEEAYICLIGDGGYEQSLLNEAKALKVDNRVILCGKVDYDLLNEYTCSADVGLCFIEPVSISYQYALPNKLFEYIMAGIPVLASDLPQIKKIIDDFHIGISIPANSSPQEIAEKLKELTSFGVKEKYKKALEIASDQFCWENQEKMIIEMVEKL
jgi:glycosyltransferase involved in cell wall biosynthesis